MSNNVSFTEEIIVGVEDAKPGTFGVLLDHGEATGRPVFVTECGFAMLDTGEFIHPLGWLGTPPDDFLPLPRIRTFKQMEIS